MDAHGRTVDHLHFAVVCLDDSIHQPIPDASLAPAVEAIVGGGVRAVPLRQIAPRCTGAQHPKDAIEDPAIVARLATSTVLGKNGFDDTPLEVGQVVAHDPSSDASQLESLFAPIRQRKLSTGPSVDQTEYFYDWRRKDWSLGCDYIDFDF